jgi:beta-lactamase regulating signal transducer with metallopeptidase domain
MGASLLHALIGATVASSMAILLVGVLRLPLRAVVGTRAAYWLWLLIPAMVAATLLPVPSGILQMSSRSLTGYMGSALSGVVVAGRPRTLSIYVVAGLVIWAAGVAVMLGLLLRRQRSFVRSLGKVTPDSGQTRRSAAIVAPMLVGAWRSRMILPVDFESRYSEAERELMLAHERAHLLRHDVSVNAVAAGWLCVFWFNPLMYWAIARLRLDQELACDAVALARTGAARQCYADALLKTQLAGESGWQMPIGCRWQSGHPLKERVTMLKRQPAGVFRRLGGIAFVLALTASGSYAAWAAESVSQDQGPQILIDIQLTTWTAKDLPGRPPGTDVRAVSTEYVVNSGHAWDHPALQPFDFGCTPFLPKQDDQASTPTEQEPSGIPAPVSGQILLRCEISYNGEVVSTPSLIALDGQPTTVKIDDEGRNIHYELKVSATTSEERMQAAWQAAEAVRARNAAARDSVR